MSLSLPTRLGHDGWSRVEVDRVTPELDGGRHAVKRIAGERIVVEADLLADGHEVLAGRLLFRRQGAHDFDEVPLVPLVNDRWRAGFVAAAAGRYEYTIEAWIDQYASWRRGLGRKVDADEAKEVDLLVGRRLLEECQDRADGRDREAVAAAANSIGDAELPFPDRVRIALDEQLLEVVARHPDRSRATRYRHVLAVVVDRPLARAGAWYEFFPRSFGSDGQHGTLADAERMLEHAAGLGFDIVYLPPIHPIGTSFRKGPNNTLRAGPDDPGSPWAIGSALGGHKAVHPDLGTLEDFDRFVARAQALRLEVALDIALQCSPDHPYVLEHPEWFSRRPDGTIQYAENPPKRYQDICPFDFECEAWQALWRELLSIFEFWCERGIRTFRVDNPHTKPLAFWEWCIASIKDRWPEAIFLSEAFTRPKMMYNLAKIGFTQSYTYFTWRRFKHELVEYIEELTRTEVAEFFRPNLWPNTPDILPDDLWDAPRSAFATRAILAATLGASYGVYGPAFELLDNVGRPGSGEYQDSEKYQLRRWHLDAKESLAPLLRRLNRLRRRHPALQRNDSVRFHECDNDELLCYSKAGPDGQDLVVVVVNLDYHHRHSGWIHFDVDELGLDPHERFQMHDLLSDRRYEWRSGRNFVEIDPHTMPAHVFSIRRFLRSEQDFDYFA
ncbi:MAG: alpha-1,4-glucan--maltose-1-phosphate maltosyltransferase [Planctomycetes bacterium]|nr:alpha-1,4-glucan--maltose-1-phosphate maltosyltransferase [Planctomycetota bacterium]